MTDRPPPYATPHALSDEELSAIYRAKLMFRVLVICAAAFLFVLVTVCAVGVWVIRGTQLHTASLAEETHRNTALIQSCVNPDGDCYKRGQRRTGDAVNTLNQTIVLSASCTAHIAVATHGLEGISQTALTKLITACVRSQFVIHQQRR